MQLGKLAHRFSGIFSIVLFFILILSAPAVAEE